MRIIFSVFLFFAISGVVCGQETASQDSLPGYLSLKIREIEGVAVLKGINSNYGPLTFYMKEEESDSVVMEKVIPPRDSLILLSSPGPAKALRDSLNKNFSLGFHLGDVFHVQPDTTYLYRLPVRKNKKYQITQGYFGKSSHNHPLSFHAIDINLMIGEPVHAAREGLVITAIGWFTRSGGKELLNYGNRILILHEDGTIAFYVHLDHKGVLVSEGERVERGQLIGYSGNTGFTSGPHLHFVVRKPRDISIPVRFEGYENKPMTTGTRIKVK